MTAKKAGKLLGRVYRGYIYKNLLGDISKFAVKTASAIPYERWLDRRFLLRKVGLKQREPVKAAFGSLGLLFLGGVAGAVTALLFAPKAGAELRPLIKERAMSYLNEEKFGTQAPASA